MGAPSNCAGGDNGPKPTRGLTETRYIFVLMAFLGTVLAIADRMALNVAIVGMVDRCKKSLRRMSCRKWCDTKATADFMN